MCPNSGLNPVNDEGANEKKKSDPLPTSPILKIKNGGGAAFGS